MISAIPHIPVSHKVLVNLTDLIDLCCHGTTGGECNQLPGTFACRDLLVLINLFAQGTRAHIFLSILIALFKQLLYILNKQIPEPPVVRQ